MRSIHFWTRSSGEVFLANNEWPSPIDVSDEFLYQYHGGLLQVDWQPDPLLGGVTPTGFAVTVGNGSATYRVTGRSERYPRTFEAVLLHSKLNWDESDFVESAEGRSRGESGTAGYRASRGKL